MSRGNRLAWIAGGFALLALTLTVVLSACGDGETASESATETSVEKCIATATAATEKAKAPIPVKLPASPLNMAANKGKSLWFVSIIENEFARGVATGFVEAAKKAGMRASVFYSDGGLRLATEGVSKAVAQGADGLVLFGVPADSVATQVGELTARGGTFVSVGVGLHDPLAPGEFAHVGGDFVKSGQLMADWMLADSKCDVRAAIFGSSVVRIHGQFMDSAKARIQRECPSCKVSVHQVDYATVATQLGPQVHTILTREGDLNYVVPVADGFVPQVEPSITDFPDVKIVSHDGVPANLAEVRSGGRQVVDGAFPPNPWIGWALVDQLGRGLQNAEPLDWTVPVRVVDRTNIGGSDADIWPGWDDFRTGFLEAWNLS